MEKYPKISIVSPSFNQGDFLEKSICSVLDQDYPELEYIIMDGGSTDHSVGIIKQYATRLKHWVSEPDRGQSHAINKGFRYATGDILGWLNSDDILLPGALKKVAEAFWAHREADVFVGTGQMVNLQGEVVYYKKPPDEISVDSIYRWLDDGNFMQPSCFFNHRAWQKCGPLDENIHIAMDVDLWIKMARHFKFFTVPHLLSSALVHENAKTTAFRNLTIVDVAIVVIRNGGEYAVRGHLENMAQKLSYAQPNLDKIINNKAFKLFFPLIRKLFRPAVKWDDTVPGWAGSKSA